MSATCMGTEICKFVFVPCRQLDTRFGIMALRRNSRFTAKGINRTVRLSVDCINTSSTETNLKVFQCVIYKSCQGTSFLGMHLSIIYLYCARSHKNSIHVSVFLHSTYKCACNNYCMVLIMKFSAYRKKTELELSNFLNLGFYTVSCSAWIEQ
jgi:hypothetical protein